MAKITINDENGNTIAEFPEGTPDAVIKKVLARDFPKAPSQVPSQEWMDQLKRRDYLQQAPMTARALKAVEGIPFVGGWVDEIAGAFSPELEAKVDAVSEAKQIEDPIESAALQAGGAIASSIVAAPILGGAALLEKAALLPRAQQALALGATGLAYGTTEGLISGAGRAEAGARNRFAGAAEGAAYGAIGGLLGGVIPVGVASGYTNLKRAFQDYGPEQIAKRLGISVGAAKVIGDTVRQSGVDIKEALRSIYKAGDEGMVADSGVAAQALLDASASFGGEAAQITSTQVSGRAARQGANLANQMDDSLGALPKVDGTGADALDIAETIASSTRPARQKAYKDAYEAPIDYSTPQGVEVENIFNALPDSFKGKAIQRANERMKLHAVETGQPEPKQIMATIADNGTISFDEMPNMQQLDEIKKSIGEVAFKEVDNLGRPTAAANDALRWYRQISERLKDANPLYREAVRVGGDKISRDNALELGLDMLKDKTTPRDVMRIMKGAGDIEKQYAKLGVRSSIDTLIGNVKATITSPDIDVNALRTTLRQLSSKSARDKIKLLMPRAEAKQLFKDLDQAQMALALKSAVAINSKTNIRGNIQEGVADLTQIGVIGHLLRAEPAKASQSLVKSITGATDGVSNQAKQAIFKDIAKALTMIKGKGARTALKVIYRAAKGQEVRDSELQAVSDLILSKSGFATIAGSSELTQIVGGND